MAGHPDDEGVERPPLGVVLRHDAIRSTVVNLETFTGGAFVVHSRPTHPIGHRLMWEQTYWLQRLGIAVPHQFRKDQNKLQALSRLAHSCELEPASYSHGTTVVDGVRDVCLNTPMLLAWFLQIVLLSILP